MASTKKPSKKSAPQKKSPKRSPSAKKTMKAAKPAGKSAASKLKKTMKAAPPDQTPAEPPLPWRHALPGETFIGIVEDYFSHVGVFSLKLEQPLAVGAKIHLRGHTTDIIQPVMSMQLDHQAVTSGNTGDAVGVRVSMKCRKGDYVYLCS